MLFLTTKQKEDQINGDAEQLKSAKKKTKTKKKTKKEKASGEKKGKKQSREETNEVGAAFKVPLKIEKERKDSTAKKQRLACSSRLIFSLLPFLWL